MRIINGKLINSEHNQLEQITQRCQTLETQIAVINQKDYSAKLQQISQEVNNSKTYCQKVNQEITRVKLSLQQAEKKINNLERKCQQQHQQLTFLKTAGIISIICLSLLISCTSNNNQNSKVRKYSQLEITSLNSIT